MFRWPWRNWGQSAAPHDPVLILRDFRAALVTVPNFFADGGKPSRARQQAVAATRSIAFELGPPAFVKQTRRHCANFTMTRDSPTLFDEGIELFNRCEFYDCHEVLEEVWTPTRQPERWFLQALIHFAVGFYHHQRGNATGATRQLRKGLRKIQPYLPEWGGVRTAAIEQQARRCLDVIEQGGRVEMFPKIERCGPYSGHDYLLENAALPPPSDRIL